MYKLLRYFGTIKKHVYSQSQSRTKDLDGLFYSFNPQTCYKTFMCVFLTGFGYLVEQYKYVTDLTQLNTKWFLLICFVKCCITHYFNNWWYRLNRCFYSTNFLKRISRGRYNEEIIEKIIKTRFWNASSNFLKNIRSHSLRFVEVTDESLMV